MPVHDVEMQHVRPGRIHGAHLVREPGEIGRQDGGEDFEWAHGGVPELEWR